MHILLNAAYQVVFAFLWFGDDSIPRQLLHSSLGQVQKPCDHGDFVENLHKEFLS
jgi:hypothetical protein